MIDNLAERPSAIARKSQQSWAEMMGAYRFLGNDSVDPQAILAAHRLKTIERMNQQEDALVIQDTSSFCFSQLLATEGSGSIAMGKFGKTANGIFVHSTLAFSRKCGPLGVLDQQMWSRGILQEGDELYENERVRWLKGLVQGAHRHRKQGERCRRFWSPTSGRRRLIGRSIGFCLQVFRSIDLSRRLKSSTSTTFAGRSRSSIGS